LVKKWIPHHPNFTLLRWRNFKRGWEKDIVANLATLLLGEFSTGQVSWAPSNLEKKVGLHKTPT
jgi:hypothetical protein